jgi:hypothetical protein
VEHSRCAYQVGERFQSCRASFRPPHSPCAFRPVATAEINCARPGLHVRPGALCGQRNITLQRAWAASTGCRSCNR